jgi:hypothetical protein
VGIQISAIGFAIVVMLAIAVVGPTPIFAQIASFEEPFPEPVPAMEALFFHSRFLLMEKFLFHYPCNFQFLMVRF